MSSVGSSFRQQRNGCVQFSSSLCRVTLCNGIVCLSAPLSPILEEENVTVVHILSHPGRGECHRCAHPQPWEERHHRCAHPQPWEERHQRCAHPSRTMGGETSTLCTPFHTEAPRWVYVTLVHTERHPGGYCTPFTHREAPWWVLTTFSPREAPWWVLHTSITPRGTLVGIEHYTPERHHGGYISYYTPERHPGGYTASSTHPRGTLVGI